MNAMLGDAMALWTWPLTAAQLGGDLMETWLGAQQVVAARLPMIAEAALSPATGDHAELGRMVSEKVDAFGRSGRSASQAGAAVRRMTNANARAVGHLAGGGMLWPHEWLRLAETNLAATAAMAALPARMLQPIHAGVSANVKRLGSRSTRG